MLRAMSVVIEMSLEHFDEFMNKCDPARPEYETLKYGVVLRRPKEDHFERVIEIRCNLAQAKSLLGLASEICRPALPAIEEGIHLAREL